MKTYKVFYIIKKNKHGYIYNMETTANNQREAIKNVKDKVMETTGRNAFHATCKEPKKTKYGLEFDGSTYTRYNPLFRTIW